jgi:tRNA 2-thiouridine synthesizing protein E
MPARRQEQTMIAVKVFMRVTGEPLKRVPVVLELDPDGRRTAPVDTDRGGVARFDLSAESGKVLVAGVERWHGLFEAQEIPIGLWSVVAGADDAAGNPGEFPSGSNAYSGMETHSLLVDGAAVQTDSEGYLVDPSDWSEAFARARADAEGLPLTAHHWAVIRFLREHYRQHGSQASVRDMVRHFRAQWGAAHGDSAALHRLFPRGGPQKQGNRLAGLLRTKGEH